MEERKWKMEKIGWRMEDHFGGNNSSSFFTCHFFHTILLFSLLYFPFSLSGCSVARPGNVGNVGNLQSYPTPAVEASWIRDGMPIEFEGALWYPADGLESMQDSEVYLVGEHKGVQVFVDKIDVRPYERLYTKFSKNRFRYFRQKDAP